MKRLLLVPVLSFRLPTFLASLASLLILGLPLACSSSRSSPGDGGTSAATGGRAGTGATTGTGGTSGTGGRTGTSGTGGTPGAGGRGTGGRGTGGALAGTGGAGTGTGTGGTPAAGTNSVLERNNHPSRDGHFVQPTLTRAAAATMAPDAGFNAIFTGSTWASPLYLENGPGGKGVFFAVTYGNDVFALDETTGAIVWQRNIGTAATGPIGCNGRTFPSLGILSTPVIDARSGTIYVAGAVGDATGIASNIVTALSTADGTVRAGWPVDVSTKLGFDPKVHIQRSALSLVNGILYVAYGGFVGDCGAYRGRVVAINTSDPTQIAGWASGGQGEGIWAAGGMASDGNGVFAITGNFTPGGVTGSTRVDSEQVMRLTGMAALDKTDPKRFFYPSTWPGMDTTDADYGTNSPVFLQVSGATPSNILATVAKDGHMFLLDAANLGGAAGTPLADFMLSTGAMSIHTVPAAYTTTQGTRVALSTDSGAICPTGSGRVVMAVSIPAGAPPVPKTLWCAAIAGGPMAPIATTTDGKNDALVWIMSGTQLNAFDGETGATVFTGGTGTCAGVQKWTSPIAVKGRIVVAANGRLCSWSPH